MKLLGRGNDYVEGEYREIQERKKKSALIKQLQKRQVAEALKRRKEEKVEAERQAKLRKLQRETEVNQAIVKARKAKSEARASNPLVSIFNTKKKPTKRKKIKGFGRGKGWGI